MTWGTPEEIERRRRIRIALWAYAYEFQNESLVDDATFDAEAKLIDTNIPTGNKKMDAWFKKEFQDYTGSWIHKHPHLKRLKQIYERLK